MLVIAIFSIFELIMPAIGMVLGLTLAHSLDSLGKYLAALILLVMGIFIFIQATFFKKTRRSKSKISISKVIFLGFVCSLDNLALGFVFGLYRLPFSIPVATGIMAMISAIMSLVGLQIGKYVGKATKTFNEQLEGVVFIIIGICFLLGWM